MLTILLPNHKTPELTKLCIRSLRKYTDFSKIKLIVIDNASNDDSLAYLKTIPYITLIERSQADIDNVAPATMHSDALDLALEKVDTPFVMTIHTDTIVHNPEWIEFLLDRFKADEMLAGVGSWKLETVPLWKIIGKKLENCIKALMPWRKKSRNYRFLRSHCAVYKTELLKKYCRGFGDGECAGLSIHRCMLAAGFKMDFIPAEKLNKYISHLNHATLILNPQFGGRKTANPKTLKKLVGKIHSEQFLDILNNDSLDH